MDLGAVSTLVVMVLVVAAIVRVMRRRRRVGSGASGAVYDLLNEDKRKAVEIIVEQRAEERDPETADGNLPDLENPDRRP